MVVMVCGEIISDGVGDGVGDSDGYGDGSDDCIGNSSGDAGSGDGGDRGDDCIGISDGDGGGRDDGKMTIVMSQAGRLVSAVCMRAITIDFAVDLTSLILVANSKAKPGL
ncbi:hypothetical protein PoB_001390400 [Plakobranchus ocellatus]|uniref:Uncharacterized protein n=1 Tax=Plakobranchus ocellatus TaxID=259542 RepID=A0AAV3Z038_9GAST|nr:hypothetical protein PoB_001390400 [Plakobranchus ocellatus]